jgi:hypothetical protein
MIQSLWRHSRTIWLNRHWRHGLIAGIMLASLAAGAWVVLRDWNELSAQPWRLDWGMLGISALVYACALGLAILGWTMIMHALDNRATPQQNAQFFLYSWIARRLPTPGPYVASRVLLYEDVGVPKRVTMMGIFWENVLLIASASLLSLVLLSMTSLVSDHMPLPLVLLTLAGGLLLVARPALLTALVNMLLRVLKKDPLTISLSSLMMLLVLLLYTVMWLLGGVILFLLASTVYPIEWDMLPLMIQSWVVSGLISYIGFLVPMGLGFRDISLVVLLALFLPLPVTIVVVLLVRMWITLNELLWAVILSRF